MGHIAALLQGIGNGSVYAALGLAIVLTFRSSGVINFATGAQALFGAYQFASLRRGNFFVPVPGLPKYVELSGPVGVWPALLIAMALNAVLGALLYAVVFRPLRNATPLARAMASLGVLVIIQEFVAMRAGTAAVTVRPIFKAKRWGIGSSYMVSDRFYLALAIAGGAVVLAAIFRFTRFGLLTRAAADSETGAYVSGISPDRIALANWMISSAVAGAAGVLIAPLSPLTPLGYTLFVVPALAAAVVGGFQNLIPTMVTGLVIGMVQSEAVIQGPRHSWLPKTGAAELVPLLITLIALLATSHAMPARGGFLRTPLGRAPRPRAIAVPAAIGTAAGLVLLAITSGVGRLAVIETFLAAMLTLSVVVVTGYAGQVSLAQLTMAGSGAFLLSGLTVSWHVPFPIAPLLAAAITTVLGVLVGLPALRLRGLTLAIVTLGFAFAIEAFWFRNTQFVDTQGGKVRSPTLFGFDVSIGSGKDFPRFSFGVVCLVGLVAVGCFVAWLRRSRLGSAMLAVRANERSAAGLGVDVVRVKIISFALASFIAGLAGSLLAYRRGTITFDTFTAVGNLTLLSTAYLAGVTSVWGGTLAGVLAINGVLYEGSKHISWLSHLDKWFAILSGVGLIVTLIRKPEGLAVGGQALAKRLPSLALRRPRQIRRTEPSSTAAPPAPAPAPAPAPVPAPAATGEGLVVSGLSLHYGAVVAVDEVSLAVRPGTVVGLIGPNGAGKTSLIDGITGFAKATGTVHLDGAPLDGLAPHARLRSGLARTFQSIELYDDLSVEENVSVAAFSALPGGGDDPVTSALGEVGIEHLRERAAGELSQGERQLVSVARALAARPRVLLLDEPAAGLDSTETRWLGERIRQVAAEGIGVLLVDHDIALVLSVCDDIYVLDLGRCIAHGGPESIRADRQVASAYLGSLHDVSAASTGDDLV